MLKIMRQNISFICGQRVPLPVLNLFHIAFVVFLDWFLIYVPSKHVAVQHSAAPTFLSRGRADGLTSVVVSIDIRGFFWVF